MKFTATHITILAVALIAALTALVLTGKVAIPPRTVEEVAIAAGGFLIGLARHPPDGLRRALGLEPLVKASDAKGDA